MTVDQLINVLVTVTLIEMMAAVGLGVTFAELTSVGRDWWLVVRAGLANYVLVPAVAVGLLLLFDARPSVAAGFLILAVCPGAPFGPPLTAVARGNVAVAAGLMVILAGSSAIIAPVLLQFLLPFLSGGTTLTVDSTQIVTTLVVTQLLPLAVGVAVRHWRPALADKLRKPADLLSKALNLTVVGVILVVRFPMLLEIQPRAYVGMSALLIASWAAGWLLGGTDAGVRKTMTLTTSLRNVGVGLVIASSAFGGTPAVTAALAYGLFEIIGSLLLALWWGRRGAVPTRPAEEKNLGTPKELGGKGIAPEAGQP